MLNQDFFYHSSIRNYIVGISHIFNDIHVQRTDDENNVIKDIKIPISYGQKTKLFRILESVDPLPKKYDTFLPRIDFELNSIKPDLTRQKNAIHDISSVTDFTFNGVAYNFIFDVNLVCRYLNDLYQGTEQILANFNPDYQNLKIDLIPSLGISPKLKVLLQGVDINILNTLHEEDFRTCEASFVFELQGYLFKPIQTQSIIDKVIVDFQNPYTEKIWNELTVDKDGVETDDEL